MEIEAAAQNREIEIMSLELVMEVSYRVGE